jgi:GT2 family glycosyltransferase
MGSCAEIEFRHECPKNSMQVATTSMVAIGIATKNRWEDLRNTLSTIANFGLGDLRTLILDDASDDPCPFDVSSVLRGAEFRRFSESKGYIVRRNQLAREMKSKYYLSLDDDSYPVGGSLDAAIKFAESRDDLFCLSFPVYNPINGQHQVKSIQAEPYMVRSFMGGGHLLHRERFLDLGGYREELVHQGEEVEISARAFLRGLHCYHFPGFQIHHVASNAGRNWHRMDFYGARNSVLWNDWFVPSRSKLVKQCRTLISRAILFLKTGRVGHLQGQISGFRDALKYTTNRDVMSPALYQKWKRLPAH